MPSSSNRLLASLSTDDFDLLAPHLEPVTLGLRKNLERPNRRIDAVYFPETGFASVVAVQSNGKQVEVGLIGREGMTGLPIVLGNHRSPHATYIQSAGMGKCIPATELRKATQTSVSLRDSLLKFVQAFGVQTTHTAVLCVKFCKGGHGWLESCGLAELDFLVLFEIVHIEIAVGFEPVLVGFDG